jgi:hypothetical protein
MMALGTSGSTSAKNFAKNFVCEIGRTWYTAARIVLMGLRPNQPCGAMAIRLDSSRAWLSNSKGNRHRRLSELIESEELMNVRNRMAGVEGAHITGTVTGRIQGKTGSVPAGVRMAVRYAEIDLTRRSPI